MRNPKTRPLEVEPSTDSPSGLLRSLFLSPLRDVDLPRWTLGIALLPWIVLGVAGYLQTTYGMAQHNLQLTLVPDGHLEAAGRLRMLATWLVMAMLGAAALALFFADAARMARIRWMLLLAWAALVAAGMLYVRSGEFEGRAEHVIGEQMICRSLRLADFPKEARKPIVRLSPSMVAEPPRKRCSGVQKFEWFNRLNGAQLYLLLFILPAIVLGAISCLAGLPDMARAQARRLDTYMYLAAALLVCGLLFLSAILRWPGYAFREADLASYTAHVSGYVLYWGVAYSLVIASFYVPVAILLSNAIRRLPKSDEPVGQGSKQPKTAASASPEPLDALKVAAAVFAPAIAGLIGEILKL
jgi:hypothetical protein